MCFGALAQCSQAEWILNANMFKNAMSSANIDVKKMPLGSLSQTQVSTEQNSNTTARSRLSQALTQSSCSY